MKRKSDSQRSNSTWGTTNYTCSALLVLLIALLALTTGTATGSDQFTTTRAANARVENEMDLEDPSYPPPDAPYDLTANITCDAFGVHEVKLEWRAETDVEGFSIERRAITEDNAEPWEVIAVIGACEFSDLIWQDSIANVYRVQTFKDGQYSDYSNEVVVEFVRP